MRPTEDEKLGFQEDRRVTIEVRIWESLRRMLIRMTQSFGYIEREMTGVMASCRHAQGCEARNDHTIPCKFECPDRELWLSALLCLKNAQVYVGSVDVPNRSSAAYIAPTREFFDRVVSELETLRAARDWLAEIEIMGVRPDDLAIVTPMQQPRTRLVAPSFDELEPHERVEFVDDDPPGVAVDE